MICSKEENKMFEGAVPELQKDIQLIEQEILDTNRIDGATQTSIVDTSNKLTIVDLF